MTKDHQAELEQAARAWLVKMGFGHRVTARGLQESVAVQKDVDSLVTLLAAQRVAGLEAAAREARRRDRGAHKELYWLAEWLNAQAQEQRP